MSLLREVYLSIFVLFYRYFGGNMSESSKAMRGSVGLMLFQAILALDLLGFACIWWHQKFKPNPVVAMLLAAALYGLNYYVLVVKGSGVNFEKQYRAFSQQKRIALRLVALTFFVGAWVLFFAMVSTYRKAFGIVVPLR